MRSELRHSGKLIAKDIEASRALLHAYASEWEAADCAAVLATLFGGIAALSQCRKLMADHYSRHGREPWQASWSHQSLLDDLARATQKDELDWSCTPNLCVWSLGFFFNKAKENIAAALDITINIWLSWRTGVRPFRLEPADDHAFYFGPYLRLRLLEALATNADARASARSVRAGFTELYDDRTATAALEKFSDAILETDQMTTLPIDDLLPSLEECLAITVGRVNAFKHRPAGNLHRMGALFFPEAIVTARALRCTTELAGSMLEDTREARDRISAKKEKAPA